MAEPEQAAEQVTLTLPSAACHPIWLVLLEHAKKCKRNGISVLPDVEAAADEIRAAGFAHLGRTNSRNAGLVADIRPGSSRGHLTTGDLAALLEVCERHARRLARGAGVRSVSRGLWRREDAAALVAKRRRT